jgi:hypothetical protein
VFERVLEAIFSNYTPEDIGNDYLIVGTIDRSVWKKGTTTHLSVQEAIEHLHDFKQVLIFERRRMDKWHKSA